LRLTCGWKMRKRSRRKEHSARVVFFCAVALLLTGALCHSSPAVSFQYNSHGRRDPFVPLVGIPEAGGRGGAGGVLTVEDVHLQGILLGPDGKHMVIINGEIMREGDSMERLHIESIDPNVVTIRIDDSRYTVKLYE